MSRPEKNTVEYIPLDCQFTDSIQAVENLYGNEGFVVWVKLLQKLGRTENYIIDVRTSLKWSLFYSIFRLTENKTKEILNLLADLDCINKELWEQGVIYSANLVKRIECVYKKRKNDLKPLHSILEEMGVSSSANSISVAVNSINSDGNTQSKVKESKVNKKKIYKEKTTTKNFKIPLIEEIKSYCLERNNNINAEQFFDYYSSKGWMIGKNKMKDWKAAVRTWERRKQPDECKTSKKDYKQELNKIFEKMENKNK